jgi:hypothetical protein
MRKTGIKIQFWQKNLKKNGFARQNAKSLRAKNEMMKIFWIKNESLTTYDHA